MTVPIEGLLLWLDARHGVTCIGDEVERWYNPAFPEGAQLRGCGDHRPTRGYNNNGPYISFGYNKFGHLEPGLPDGVRTIVSVHTFGTEIDINSYGGVSKCQFYIISGDCQGPFHAESEQICSGHGSWAGGEAFCNGTIRLDGADAVAVKSVTIQEFVEPRLAVVQCTEPGCVSLRGPGMNRIGRDRNCHAYNGILHALLVYNRALLDEEIIAIESHMRQCWLTPCVVALSITEIDASLVEIKANGMTGNEILRCEFLGTTTLGEVRAKILEAIGDSDRPLQLISGVDLLAVDGDSKTIHEVMDRR